MRPAHPQWRQGPGSFRRWCIGVPNLFGFVAPPPHVGTLTLGLWEFRKSLNSLLLFNSIKSSMKLMNRVRSANSSMAPPVEKGRGPG